MTVPVRYDVAAGRATVTLDRQETRNALDGPAIDSLGDALDAAERDDAVRLVVLTHRGPVFCSGADLRAATGAPAAEQPVRRFPEVLQRIQTLRKPVLAAVDGKVRAGGVGLVAVCDLVLATPASDFATSEVRLGLAPFVISVPFLERVAAGAAREWFLTGSVFDGTRAHRDGLVDVLTEDLSGTVDRLAGEIALGGPDGLAAAKRLLRGHSSPGALAARYAALADESARLFAAEEGQEGIAAMREKRRPAWAARPLGGQGGS